MVHMKSVLVTIVSAKTKYYEKLIISLQIISVRSNVITVISPIQLSL